MDINSQCIALPELPNQAQLWSSLRQATLERHHACRASSQILLVGSISLRLRQHMSGTFPGIVLVLPYHLMVALL